MQKLEELRKEKEHERELTELRQLEEKAGLRRYYISFKCKHLWFRTQTEKLDWMYSHSVVDKKESENEAIITGKKVVTRAPLGEKAPKQQTMTSDKIITSRLSEDPLFDMKKTELKKDASRRHPRIGKVSK